MDILTIGLAVCDVIVKPVTPELFQRDSTPVEITMLPGGDACNVAVNAAALGLKTGLVTTVGDDANGRFIAQYLHENGVNVSALKVSKKYGTGTSIVMVEPEGERHFLSSTGVFEDLYPNQVTKEMLDGVKVLSLNSCYRLPNLDDGGIVPTFQMAHEMGVLTAMDSAWNRKGDWMERIRQALVYTDIFLPSYQEAVQITGKTDVRAMREVMSPFGLKTFAVKMGDQGSYVTDFRHEFFVQPFHVEQVVNTVGAGDSFVAGFLTAQAKGMDLYESAVFASAVASFTVQSIGAVGGVPTMEEVEKYIMENKRQ